MLADAGEGIAKFLSSGLVELGDKLGPILWQFMATKRFDPDDFGTFLKLLPTSEGGIALRHAVEVRHDSFRDPVFVTMARAAGVAIVFADSPDYPTIPDHAGDFVYARLLDAREEEPTGYDAPALDRWAGVARDWAAGGSPPDLPYVTSEPAPTQPRDVFVFMINGAKVRAPAAAQALLARLAK